MDYSKMSDFEINGLVAAKTQRAGDYTQAREKNFIHEYADVGELKGICVGWKEFDPCNNAADAWPIISANRISIEYDSETQCDVPVEWVTAYGIDDLKVQVVPHQPCDKALRSAMIVFLMMQEAK